MSHGGVPSQKTTSNEAPNGLEVDLEPSRQATEENQYTGPTVELILGIARHLQFIDLVALAQTKYELHRILLHLTQRRWQAMIPRGRHDLLRLMWERWEMTRSYICFSCCAFHLLDQSNVPSSNPGLQLDANGNESGGKCANKSRNSYNQLYRLEQHHIAYAMASMRQKKTLKPQLQGYVDNILKSRTWESADEKSAIANFQANPYIIDHGFVLHTSWTLRKSALAAPGLAGLSYFRICPHLFHNPGQIPDQLLPTNLVYMLTLCNSSLERESEPKRYFTCRHGPTDYSIRVTSSTLELNVFQQLGYGAQLDSLWQAQIKEDQAYLDAFPAGIWASQGPRDCTGCRGLPTGKAWRLIRRRNIKKYRWWKYPDFAVRRTWKAVGGRLVTETQRFFVDR